VDTLSQFHCWRDISGAVIFKGVLRRVSFIVYRRVDLGRGAAMHNSNPIISNVSERLRLIPRVHYVGITPFHVYVSGRFPE
jgi:hypothetical protein